MELTELSLKTVKDLDWGKVVLAFDRHLRLAADDCLDRPGDDKGRRITLTCEIKPLVDQTGDAGEIAVEFRVKSSVPEHRSKVFNCKPRRGGHLLFNPECPDSATATGVEGLMRQR